MNKLKLVMTCAGKISEDTLKKIDSGKFEILQVTDNKTDDEIIEAIKDADVVYLGGDDYFSKKVLEGASKLKLLVFAGIGYESYIDVDVATELGIAIANTPEANSDSVAEFSIGLLQGLQRNIVQTNNLMKKGIKDRIVSRDIGGQSVGIIGMGAIAFRVANILVNGFGADVSYYNRTRRNNIEDELGISYKPLENILKESDIVFIIITENSSTQNFIGKKELNLMKDSAVLINPARPILVDAEALFDALSNKKIKGCAMDGYYTKPDEDTYGLLKLDDSTFICSADVACRTFDAWEKMEDIAFRNISDFFETGTSKNIVNPEYKKNVRN